MEVAALTFALTAKFPARHAFTIGSQMERAALSIPSNLAEGYRRRNEKEWKQYCHVAFGSAAELETQLELARNLKLAPEDEFRSLNECLQHALRLLNGLCKALRE